MKKFLRILLVFVVCLSTVCFATDADLADVENESSTSNDSVTTVEDPNDANDIYDGLNTQSEYKEYYREYLAYSREQDANTTVTDTVKAKVIDVEPVKTEYGMEYYMPYKRTYQPIVIEILEGEYAGEKLETEFYLVPDTYENTRIKEVKTGDRIFVTVAENEDKLVAYVISYDSGVSRVWGIVFAILIAVVLVVLIGKEKGLKTLLLVLLVIDLIFVVTIPEFTKTNKIITLESEDENFPTEEEIDEDTTITILQVDDAGSPTKVEIAKKNNNAFFIILIDVVLVAFVNLINKLGLGKKIIQGFVITLCMIAFTTLLVLGIMNIAKLNGNSFEAVSIAENIINKNVDFNAVYMLSILMIATVLISNIVSEMLSDEGDLEKIKTILEKQVNIIIVFAIMFLMPKVLALTIYKYTLREMMNSEMIGLEIVRIATLVIVTMVTLPVTSYVIKKMKTKE